MASTSGMMSRFIYRPLFKRSWYIYNLVSTVVVSDERTIIKHSTKLTDFSKTLWQIGLFVKLTPAQTSQSIMQLIVESSYLLLTLWKFYPKKNYSIMPTPVCCLIGNAMCSAFLLHSGIYTHKSRYLGFCCQVELFHITKHFKSTTPMFHHMITHSQWRKRAKLGRYKRIIWFHY